MGSFAQFADPEILFMEEHSKMILSVIQELFDDKVLGKREWKVVVWDTYIKIEYQPELESSRADGYKGGYIEVRPYEVDNNVLIVDTNFSFGNGRVARCFPDKEDFTTALLILLGKALDDIQTKYEKQNR